MEGAPLLLTFHIHAMDLTTEFLLQLPDTSNLKTMVFCDGQLIGVEDRIDSDQVRVFVEALQTNTSLEQIKLSEDPNLFGNVWTTMEYCLTLNRYGRRFLSTTAAAATTHPQPWFPPSLWGRVLAKASGNVDHLSSSSSSVTFYILRTMPSLVRLRKRGMARHRSQP